MSLDRVPHDVVEIRRDFHRHPEVGFTEFRTASRIAAALDDAGWDVRVGAEAIAVAARLGVPCDAELAAAYSRAERSAAVPRYLEAMRGGLTAVAADLPGHQQGPTIAIRLDIDALPIAEAECSAHPAVRAGYRSTIDGAMHACGHDGHAAIGVALARRLSDREFPGRVRLLFQPAEEGARGAAALVSAGVVNGVDRLFCVHLGLGLPTGSIAPSVVGLLANTKLRARFAGVAAHAAAAPQDGRHALLAAATAVLNLHGMPRFAGADTRVNVGMLTGGTSANIVPAAAEMLLETRADDETANRELARRARRILAGAGHAHEVDVEVEVIGAASTGSCSPAAADALARSAAGLTVVSPFVVGVSDDATALMRAVQQAGGDATYCVIGADLAGPHHTPGFDFDESVLSTATDVLERSVRGPRA